MDENIIKKIMEINEMFKSHIYIESLTSEKKENKYHFYNMIDGEYNLRYENIDIYFYKDRFNIYIDDFDLNDVYEFFQIIKKQSIPLDCFSFSGRMRVSTLADLDYKYIDSLYDFIPVVLKINE